MKKIKPRSFISSIIGITLNFAISYGLSYVLFTVMILKFGYVWGVILSWSISFIVFYSMFLLYAWTKRDWLSMEKIKASIKKDKGDDLFSKILIYANKKGEILFFIVLSAKLGPFTSLLYTRDAYDYRKMNSKDWKIFLLGYAIMNLSCTIVILPILLSR